MLSEVYHHHSDLEYWILKFSNTSSHHMKASNMKSGLHGVGVEEISLKNCI